MAALLIGGRRMWPAIFAGALIVDAARAEPLSTAAGIAVGNTLGPLLAWFLLRQARFDRRLARTRDFLALAVAAPIGMLVTASAGTLNLVLGGLLPWASYRAVWWVWWVGDSLGVVVFAPLLLTFATDRRLDLKGTRLAELVGLSALALAVAHAAFWGWLPASTRVEYAIFPLIVWAALRFGPRETSLLVTAISGMAIWGAVHERGPFASGPLDQRLMLLDLFIAVAALTGMSLATRTAERRRVLEALHRAHDDLEGRVRDRTAQLAAANDALRVTAAKRDAEQARLAEAQQIAHVGSWEWDVESDHLTWSSELCRIFDYDPQEFRPSIDSFVQRLHPEDRDRVSEVVQAAVRDGHLEEHEYRVVVPSGEVRFVHARGRTIADESGTVTRLVGTAQEVTEQVRLRRELARHAAELSRSNEELEGFAYAASHDLRAPLRAIANLSQWIKEDPDNRLSDESRGHASLLEARVRRMDRLLRDLLEYSKIGRVQMVPERVDLRELVSDVAETTSLPAGFTLEAEGPMPALWTSRLPLRRVLLNLVDNAVKHHDRERGRVVVSAREADQDWVTIVVRDDGPGIAAQHRERVFQMFQTLKPRDVVEGSGMGLALVRKIVETAGGQIEIVGGEERGTTLQFTWPRAWRQASRAQFTTERLMAIGQ